MGRSSTKSPGVVLSYKFSPRTSVRRARKGNQPLKCAPRVARSSPMCSVCRLWSPAPRTCRPGCGAEPLAFRASSDRPSARRSLAPPPARSAPAHSAAAARRVRWVLVADRVCSRSLRPPLQARQMCNNHAHRNGAGQDNENGNVHGNGNGNGNSPCHGTDNDTVNRHGNDNDNDDRTDADVHIDRHG